MSEQHTNGPVDRSDLDAALAALRPDLHRFLSRMMGSVFDGEDVVQDTLISASLAFDRGTEIHNLRAWLFRIAHNTALNALRARKSEHAMKERFSNEIDPYQELPKNGGAKDALVPFLALTPKQRSAVILRDVFGYSTDEVAGLTGMTHDGTKSALKRGRIALRSAPEATPQPLSEADRARLETYARHFNEHNFDQLRAMLSQEVRLDVVSVETRDGAHAVGNYFGNYSQVDDWLMVPGQVENKPAILVFDRTSPEQQPTYFVRLDFADDDLTLIQDFRYARYVMQGATWSRDTF